MQITGAPKTIKLINIGARIYQSLISGTMAAGQRPVGTRMSCGQGAAQVQVEKYLSIKRVMPCIRKADFNGLAVSSMKPRASNPEM